MDADCRGASIGEIGLGEIGRGRLVCWTTWPPFSLDGLGATIAFDIEFEDGYPSGEGRLALTAGCGDRSGKGGSMIVSTWNKWALIRMSGVRDGVPALAGRKRRVWTQDDKRRIVDESLAGGASIAEVARRHDLNANQVFTWRRQIGGEPVAPKELTPILPVTIVAEPAAEESDPASSGQMEIVLAEGDRIIVWADVGTAALTRVLKALARR